MQPIPFTKYEGLAIQEICVYGIRTIVGNKTTKEFINESNHELYFLIGIRGRGKSPSGRREFCDSVKEQYHHSSYTDGLYIVDYNVNHYYFGATHSGYYRIYDKKYFENPWIIQPIHSLMPALGKRNRKLIKRTICEYLKTIGDQTCQTAMI